MAPCHLTPLVPAKILSPPLPPLPYSSRPFAKRGSDEELASGVGMGGVFGLKHRLSTPRLVGPGADGVVRRPAEARATGCARIWTASGDSAQARRTAPSCRGISRYPFVLRPVRPGRRTKRSNSSPIKPARRQPLLIAGLPASRQNASPGRNPICRRVRVAPDDEVRRARLG